MEPDQNAIEPQAVPGKGSPGPAAVGPETISGDDLIFIQVARNAQTQAAVQLAGALQARDAADAQWNMASSIVAQKHRLGPYDSINDQNGAITRVAQQNPGPIPLPAAPGDSPVVSESGAGSDAPTDLGE